MGQLDNRVAIITGAGWGIGKVIALAYAREGAKLVLATRPRRRPRLTPGSCVPRVPRWSGLQQGVARGGAGLDRCRRMGEGRASGMPWGTASGRAAGEETQTLLEMPSRRRGEARRS
jgi:NAD(P)-dependent dehydrogenase (short-subunit alcohol dehydrogenase family)